MDAKTFFNWALAISGAFAIYKILQKIGIIGTKEDAQAEALLQSDTLTVGYDKTLGKLYRDKYGRNITRADIDRMVFSGTQNNAFAGRIVKAKGIFNDDETAIYTVFRQFKSKFQLYFFSRFFLATKGKDLVFYLSEFMNNEEVSRIFTIIDKLPTF